MHVCKGEDNFSIFSLVNRLIDRNHVLDYRTDLNFCKGTKW
jgi:hypothetical protein